MCTRAEVPGGEWIAYRAGDLIGIQNGTGVRYCARAGAALVGEARRPPYDPLLALAPLDLLYFRDAFDSRLVREATVDGSRAHVVECRPKQAHPWYTRRELYLDAETGAILRHDAYAKVNGGPQEFMQLSEVWHGHEDFGVLKAGIPTRREITLYTYLEGRQTELARIVSVLSDVAIYMSTPDPAKEGKRLMVAGVGPEEQQTTDLLLPRDTVITFDEPAFWAAVRAAR